MHGLTRNRILSLEGWLACHTWLPCHALHDDSFTGWQMAIRDNNTHGNGRKWLWHSTTLLFNPLPLGDECVTQSVGLERRVPWYRYHPPPSFPRLECEPTVLTFTRNIDDVIWKFIGKPHPRSVTEKNTFDKTRWYAGRSWWLCSPPSRWIPGMNLLFFIPPSFPPSISIRSFRANYWKVDDERRVIRSVVTL